MLIHQQNMLQDHVRTGTYQRAVMENKIDFKLPLVGYAIEFPPIENDPGGTYLQGDYELDVDEEISNEIEDEIEGIIDINDV
jgi:hypothetical protein